MDKRDGGKFNTDEHKRCYYVWPNTFQKKVMKFLLTAFNKPVKLRDWLLISIRVNKTIVKEWFKQQNEFTTEFEAP